MITVKRELISLVRRTTQVWLGKVQHADILGSPMLPTANPTFEKWMHTVIYM